MDAMRFELQTQSVLAKARVSQGIDLSTKPVLGIGTMTIKLTVRPRAQCHLRDST